MITLNIRSKTPSEVVGFHSKSGIRPVVIASTPQLLAARLAKTSLIFKFVPMHRPVNPLHKARQVTPLPGNVHVAEDRLFVDGPFDLPVATVASPDIPASGSEAAPSFEKLLHQDIFQSATRPSI